MGNDRLQEWKRRLTAHQDANCVDLCAKMFPNALERPDMVTVLSSGAINDVLDQAIASLEQGVSVLVKGGGVKVPQVSGRTIYLRYFRISASSTLPLIYGATSVPV